MLELVFLTADFYSDYAGCKEIEQKQDRPHVCATFLIDGFLCCVPFRSHIKHSYAIWTDKNNRCGLDFSKTVIITNRERYIDKTRRPHLRPNEFDVFTKVTAHDMQVAMNRYLTQYRRAKKCSNNPRNSQFLKCSCLQYFEDLLEL